MCVHFVLRDPFPPYHTQTHTLAGGGRIRGHSQLQGEHEAFEEVFRQLWDLFWKDLTDEGDEFVVLVTQRGELENSEDMISMSPQTTS